MNKIYGFEGEVLHKYDIGVMNLFTEVGKRFNLAIFALLGRSKFIITLLLRTGVQSVAAGRRDRGEGIRGARRAQHAKRWSCDAKRNRVYP